jgi:hypothetical protein
VELPNLIDVVMFYREAESRSVTMCESYRRPCACGEHNPEIFFKNNVFDARVVKDLFCPRCRPGAPFDPETTIEDNGWILELDGEVLRSRAAATSLDPESITADQVFDADYVTWVGFTPLDGEVRNQEREELARRYADDRRAHFLALREWAMEREKKLAAEGWRKALRSQR